MDVVLGACGRRRAQFADAEVPVDELLDEANEVRSGRCHGDPPIAPDADIEVWSDPLGPPPADPLPASRDGGTRGAVADRLIAPVLHRERAGWTQLCMGVGVRAVSGGQAVRSKERQ